jgi:hypothetical protein
MECGRCIRLVLVFCGLRAGNYDITDIPWAASVRLLYFFIRCGGGGLGISSEYLLLWPRILFLDQFCSGTLPQCWTRLVWEVA